MNEHAVKTSDGPEGRDLLVKSLSTLIESEKASLCWG